MTYRVRDASGSRAIGSFLRKGSPEGDVQGDVDGIEEFVLLARRRWEKITAAQLEEAFALIRTGRS
jgi:hypothetical protein